MAEHNPFGKLLNFGSKISLGIVIVLFLAWMYLRTDTLFPQNPMLWNKYILTYILLTSLVFSFNALASDKTEKVLFRVSFLKEFPKLLLSVGISGVFFYVVGYLLKGQALPTIASALTSTPFAVLVLYTFVVATSEELIFRGWLPNEMRARKISKVGVYIIQTVVFAFFHWFVSGSVWTIVIYIPLGLLFMYVKDKFSPKTNMANIGVHATWNAFILGFMS